MSQLTAVLCCIRAKMIIFYRVLKTAPSYTAAGFWCVQTGLPPARCGSYRGRGSPSQSHQLRPSCSGDGSMLLRPAACILFELNGTRILRRWAERRG